MGDFTLQLLHRGLRTSPGPSGQPEADGLRRADNVAMNREGELEPRRGQGDYLTVAGETFDDLGAGLGGLVSHTTAGNLRHHDVAAGVTTLAPKTLASPAEGQVRTVEAARCLFVRHASGVDRLDAVTGTPRPAGVVPALDAEAALINPTADGVAVPGDSQVAYRTCFGVRDANGRLILGSPSGRAIVQSVAVAAPVGSMSWAASPSAVVTVTITGHGFVNNERVTLTGSDPAILNGTFTVTVSNANVFSFSTVIANAGALTLSTVPCWFARTARDANISASIPPGAGETPGLFARFYRSLESVSYDVPPSDEMGLVAEVLVPDTAHITTLARTGTTVTATTSPAHTIPAGTLVQVTGLAGASGQDVSVGDTVGTALRSTDAGATWGASATLTGNYLASAWSGSIFCAAGDNVLATSPTGETWTTRTPAVASRRWTHLTYGAGRFLALSAGSGTEVRAVDVVAETVTSTGITSDELLMTGFQPGAVITVGGTWVREYPVTRTLTVTGQYRVSGGTWTALGAPTLSMNASSGSIALTLGTLPTNVFGSVDVRISTTISNGTAWPSPRNVKDPETGEWVWTEYLAASYVTSVTATGIAPKAQSSADGTTWAEVTLPSGAWDSITHDGSRFLLAGHALTDYRPFLRSATSSDGSTWTTGTAGAVQGFPYHCTGNGAGRTVAVWASGSAWTTDGTTWNAAATPPSGGHRAVAYVLGTYISVGASVSATSGDGVVWTAGGTIGDAYAVACDGAAALAVGTNVAYTSSDYGVTWTSRTASGALRSVSASPTLGILGGVYAVTAPVTSTTFTFTTAATGTIDEATATQDATIVAVGLVDNVATGMLGEAAYWNASQGGILSSHDLPPDCLDMAVFRDHVFFAAPKRAPVLLASLLKVGTGGLAVNDVVTLPSGTVVAKAAEAALNSPPEFAVYTDGTAAANLFRTMQSLVRVINRRAAWCGCTAIQTSLESDPSPGGFALISPGPHQAVSFGSTTAAVGVFSPAGSLTVQPSRELNVVAYSLPGMPDSVPALNTLPPVGSASLPVLALRALRDSLLILKADGAWRLTGWGADSWSVQPLDATLNLIAPNTARVLGGLCLALTSRGVAAIGDTGVQVISDNISDLVDAVLAPSMRSVVSSLAHGVSYDADDTYTLWTPSSSSSTVADQGWVYRADKSEWTARTDPWSAAIVLPANDRLYTVRGPLLAQERKDLLSTDLVDGTLATGLTASARVGAWLTMSSVVGLSVGDVLVQGGTWDTIRELSGSTVRLGRASAFVLATADITALAGFDSVIEWAPRYAPQAPQRHVHVRELGLLFRDAHVGEDTIVTSSDTYTTEATVPLDGASLTLVDSETVAERNVRVLVPREHARCTRLHVTLTHRAGRRPFRLEGMTSTFNPGSEKGAR